ncbi:MAG TPA: aryl-sulfate sulfotransferase [Bryobacteraceae bacterium]|nr:aryl-sulfate sulfotransferase [Bryobacteraceae bacterium]
MMGAAASYVLAVCLGTCICAQPASATITNVGLRPSVAPPQLLGATINLTASATDTDPGPLTYKWEVEQPGSTAFSVMRDFDVNNTFTWVPNYVEGAYQLRLTARDYLAGTSAQKVLKYTVSPLVTGNQPVVVATANPLVALFSSPTCPIGSTMAVVFQQQGSATQSTTDARPCHAGTQNFYIGNMLSKQTYTMYAQVDTGGTIVNGPSVSFTSGTIPTNLAFATRSVPMQPDSETDAASDIVLTGYATSPDFPTATDLKGDIVWYYGTTVQMTRPVPGGTFLSIPNGKGTGTGVWGPNVTQQQLLREFDLAGNTIRETNCDRVYEQLEAMGLTAPLGRFNHDAIRLANGQTVVLGDEQQIFPAGTQGSTAPIDIIGALIIVLDENFQVVSYWSSFDHDCASSACLNINRAGDTQCGAGTNTGGCPPVLLSSPANDWLHANSLQYLTAEGDWLLSLRNQNWIVKIDYSNGTGTNGIIWRLGIDGDFALGNNVGEPYPWFSGQHNPGFVDDGETTLAVFDNGTNRHATYGGDSRGQVWTIDQTNMIATLDLNVDLGAYSPSLGSAQVLLNGDYMFMAGNIQDGSSIEVQSSEFDGAGVMNYRFQSVGPSHAYRGWRLPDFYHAALNGSAGPD